MDEIYIIMKRGLFFLEVPIQSPKGILVFHFLEELCSRYPMLDCCQESLRRSFAILTNLFRQGHKVLICGNGGSAADAGHFSAELLKGFLRKRPLSNELCHAISALAGNEEWIEKLQLGLPVIPLTTNPEVMTAISNDQDNELIFAQQVLAYGQKGDGLIAISTSGRSPNIIKAIWVGKALGLTTIGLTGADGGLLRNICDITIKVPAVNTYEIQEYHLPVYHTLCAMIEEEFFASLP